MLLLTHRLTVRFRDCDAFGHVNNAVYLTYLEQARFTLWKEQFGMRPGQDRQPGMILARVEIDYRSQARYGDELEVRLALDAIGRSSFTYSYEVIDTVTSRQVAHAKSIQVHFDYAQNRPVAIDEALRARLSAPVER
jgi:acyl-CoA thioester hydrolase